MTENQIVEYKESWKDEYLKWICGFANAQGGILYIGIDDQGNVIGLKNVKKLLEDIPNKIQSSLGIVAEVNVLTKNSNEYLEIRVKASSYPINYNGEYHIRSGTTKQLLKGIALTEFIRSKTGYLWDAIPMEQVSIKDLDPDSIQIFRNQAKKSNRLDSNDLNISDEELLEHLNLLEDHKLKRAAILLFHPHPSRFITGCYVKIGMFGEGSNIIYQDLLENSLIKIADTINNLIYTKYLKGIISYKNDLRVETFPFPRESVREAIYNALCHNNYSAGVPIQIRIQPNAMYISNSCILPKDWTEKTLMEFHKSKPYNPTIANVFYRAGYIEALGRGIEKIVESYRIRGVKKTKYKLLGDDLTLELSVINYPNAESIEKNKPTEK